MSDLISEKEIYDSTMRVIKLILQIHGTYTARSDFYMVGTTELFTQDAWKEIASISEIMAKCHTNYFVGHEYFKKPH